MNYRNRIFNEMIEVRGVYYIPDEVLNDIIDEVESEVSEILSEVDDLATSISALKDKLY